MRDPNDASGTTAYRHTQRGTLILVALAFGLALTILIAGSTSGAPRGVGIVLLLTGALLVAAMVVFGSLTVEIGGGRLGVRFGPGLVRKSFALDTIRSADPVRNRWWYGWGVRLTPHGWLYNVSGLDAVEIALDDGRRVRIGTDEPLRLAAAIRDAAGSGSGPG